MSIGNGIYTIGHSTHVIDVFLELLRRHDITAVADMRSAPFSRFNPQFHKKTLQGTLAAHGIKYIFLGGELGARGVLRERTRPICPPRAHRFLPGRPRSRDARRQ